MKKKSLQLACSLALAVSMVTQVIYPSAALIADTIETDPDVEITSESSYETSETSEESYPVDVSEPSASTDYTYVEETADLDETETNDPSSDETDAISSATDPDPTAETTDETVIETEETEETEETIEEEESTVEIIEASDMDAFLDEVTALPSSYRVIVSTTIDISDSIENVVGVYYDGLYILSFEDEASYSAAISFFSNCGISYCQDGTVEVNGVADYFHPISNAEINANGTVRVAIIDTGSNLANESYSVIGDYTGDDNGHGTRMAQLVLDNDTDNAYIISIKALGSDGHGSIVDVYNAVQLALDLGADYILMSFSTLNSTEYTAFKDLLSFANSVGATVVASAGNNGMNAAFYVPACASGVTTVGALNDDFTKQNTSNYGPCVNYYVVADSTSDAAALYVGYSLAGNSGNIYTTYLSESASLSDSELYDLYSDIANEITNELIAEYGYGECRLEINENGEFVFVYVFEGSASSDVVINARPDSELVNYATSDIGASPVTITDGMSGTDSGTAVYSQGSYPGWGSISSISSSGTTGSGLRLTQFASTMAVCCSRAFGGENSRYATPLTNGQAVEYSASYTVSGGRITWTVMVGAPGRNLTQPTWEGRSLNTTWRIAVQGGSTGVEYVAYVNGSGAGTVSATEAGAITTITNAVNAAVADIRNSIANDEFGAKRNLRTTGLPTGVGSGTAVSTWEVTVDPQIFEGRLSAGQPDTPHAAIRFNKIDSATGQSLSGCIVYLLCTGGDGVGHTGELTSTNVALSPITFNGNTGVQFTTNGSTVRIEGLSPNSSYMFYEYAAPTNQTTGNPYNIATPRSSTFSTNSNGDIINVSASGDWSFSSSTATITLENGEQPKNPDFSSIGVLKIWSEGYNSFFQDTQFVSFAIQYRGSWDTYEQYGWGDSWSYGRIRNPSGSSAYVGWLTTRESAVAYGGIDTLYSGDNQYIEGRYYQHLEGGQFVDNEGDSYDWNHDLTYLPFGYYHITEYWNEAYISMEGRKEFAESANISGWTLEQGGPGTGSCQYGIIIKIDGSGTWICDSNGNPISGMPISGGVRLESVTNDTRQAALDVRKIDLTGTGVDGVSFALYREGTQFATGTLASTPSGTTTDNYGNEVNYYDVSWNYRYNQAYRTDDSAWHYRELELTDEDVVQHLNYTTYQIREYITDMRGYRVPEGWEGMDADGDGVYEYFYMNVNMSAAYHNEPLTVDCANRQYRLRVTANKVDQWSGQIITNYGGSYDAIFELYADLNENGAIDSSDTLIATLSDTDRDGVVLFDYLLDDLFPNVTNPADYPSHYLVREVTAPFDYYLNPTTFSITANDTVGYDSTVDVTDTPYTAQIHMYKLDGDTGENIATAQFTIYNDVDGNKVYTEGVDTLSQTWSEAEGLHNAQIVWNQAEGYYVSSPLRSGNYIVVETGLPSGYFYVDANGQPTLARNEVYFEIVGKDVSQVSSENPLEDVYEGTVYNLSPSIQTTFHDPVTMSQTAHVDDDIELIDTVSYTNLVPNVEVRLDAVVMVKSTGQPLLDANGNQVTGHREFTPSSPNGTIDVSIHLDTNYVMSLVENGTLSAPVDLVCFETLSFTATTDVTPYHQWYDENPITEHKEIDDLGQTVRVAEVHTGVYDNQTLSQVASDGPNGDGYAVIVDHVHYEGLAPGHTYTMRGEMHLLTYGEDGNAVDGGVLEGADARENLHPTTTFTPTDHEGYVDVTYTINVNRFRGQTTVSYEYCEENGRTIVFHEDIEDLPQTLFIPDVHTNAYCPDTTPGDMGRTVIGLQQRARIVDEVTYENLLVDGRQYMIQGCLYWMYTDENGTIHSGPMADIIGEAQATSTIFFTPTEQDGTIEMLFTFDSTVLADLHYDRLVVCESIFVNGGIGWKRIANHWDFRYENNSQSIYVPDVHTTASTGVGQTLPEGQNPDIMPVTVSDRVFYENLVPGTEYTVVGNLQYAITDENGNITESGPLVQNGVEVKAQQTFVPTSSSGYVDLEFTVNAADIMAHGYDRLIAFEEVYVGPGVLVALHADITDEEQTIYVPPVNTPTPTPPETPPKTGDESGYANYVVGAIVAITFLAAGIALLAVLDRKNNPDDKKKK